LKKNHFTNILVLVAVFFVFTGCAGKDMKKFGGEFALVNQTGEPISTAVTITLGVTIYGIGALVDSSREEEQKPQQQETIFLTENNQSMNESNTSQTSYFDSGIIHTNNVNHVDVMNGTPPQ